MASFQQDFKVDNISNLIDMWNSSDERKKGLDAQSYYLGSNITILAVKKYFWSDKAHKQIENPYVANFKIGYSKYHDIVAQKVDTLLNEAPTITGMKDDAFLKNIGYALKRASVKASNFGKAFIFVGQDSSIKVFDTENCIPFYDDQDGEKIMAFIRYWSSSSMSNQSTVYFAEVYEQDGMTVYEKDSGGKYRQISPKVAYKFSISKDAIGTISIPQNPSIIPIVELDNNDEKMNDFPPNVRSKIDQIDILQSGFANNIDDFSEMYWVIKNGGGMTNDELEDFVTSISRTKKLLISGDVGSMDVDTKQGNIPYQARQQLIDTLKKDLTEDTGVIDTATMTGASLTTTAIKAATMKLRQRVSDFEWQVYKTVTNMVNIWQQYHNQKFTFDVNFTELLINNDTELIDNAVKIRDTISKKSYLDILKRANYIEDVDKELAQIDKEASDKFTLEDNSDGGQGTSTDGQGNSTD
jgi:hypothetical protein